MKKIMLVIMVMTLIAFGFSATSFAAGMDKADKSMGMGAKDVSAWIGKDVKNAHGEDLGKISEFITDEGGEVSLAVISHGGFMGFGEKKVAVPFSLLSFKESEDHAVLDVDRDRFANAPTLREGENLNDRTFAEEVYRYFGARPYWSDEGASHQYFGDTPEDTHGYSGSDEGFQYDRNMKSGSDFSSDF